MASTLTTVVVFLPVVFMRGMSGVIYQQMAYVVTFSLLCSLVVALTLVPMLSSKLLRTTAPAERHQGDSLLQRVYSASEARLSPHGGRLRTPAALGAAAPQAVGARSPPRSSPCRCCWCAGSASS